MKSLDYKTTISWITGWGRGMAVVKFKNGNIGTIEGTTNVYLKILRGNFIYIWRKMEPSK